MSDNNTSSNNQQFLTLPTISAASGMRVGVLDNNDNDNPTKYGSKSEDYRLIDFIPGQPIWFQLGSPDFNTYIQIVDVDTQQAIVGNGYYYLNNSQLFFTPESNKNYIVRVTSYYSGAEGNYNLKAIRSNLTNTPLSEIPVISAASSTASGTLSETDFADRDLDDYYMSASLIDEYRLSDLTSGQTVKLNLSGSLSNPSQLRLINADTRAVITYGYDLPSNNSNSRAGLVFTPEPGINYIVQVIGSINTTESSYTLNTTPWTFSNTSFSELPEISAINGTIDNGILSETDLKYSNSSYSLVDEYRLTDFTPNQPVRLNLSSPSSGTQLRIINAQTQEVVASSYSLPSSNGSHLGLTFFPKSGIDYIVQVQSNTHNAESSYTLNSALGNSPNNEFEQLVEISAANGGINTTLSASDSDNPIRVGSFSDDYRLTNFTPGKVVTLQVSSSNFKTYLQVINANTQQVIAEKSYDSVNNSSYSYLNFTPQSGTNYIVRVTSNDIAEQGNYTLKAITPESLPSISANGGRETGRLEEGDFYSTINSRSFSDSYLLKDLTPGQTTKVFVSSTDFRGNVELKDADTLETISVIRGSGYGFGFAYGEERSTFTFTPEANKKYVVQVSNNDNSTQAGNYTLGVGLPDLKITNAAIVGQPIYNEYFGVTFTVTNEGNVDSGYLNRLYDAVYLSTNNNYLDSYDRLLGSTNAINNGVLAPGQSYTNSYNYLSFYTSDKDLIGEDLWLLFVTNKDKTEYESNENNNVVSLPFKILTPDIEVTEASISAPPLLNQPFSVSWTVKNQGEVDAVARYSWNERNKWYDGVYLSYDDKFDLWGDSLVSRFELEPGSKLSPNGQYTFTKDITISEGIYDKVPSFMLFVSNTYNAPYEANSSNNVKAVQIDWSQVFPDLKISSVSAPSTTVFGQEINFSWTVNNIGKPGVPETWKDRIWLSKDDKISDDDIELFTSLDNSQSKFGADGSYTDNIALTLPLRPDLDGGFYNILVKTDAFEQQKDSNLTNNVKAQPILIALPPIPDLVVSSVIVPVEGLSGQQVEIVWTVKNQGNGNATGTWNDYIYLSDDAQIGNDSYFDYFEFDGTIAAGQSIERRKVVELPIDLSGNRWVVVKTDANSQVYEHKNENNNAIISGNPINVRLRDFPNLKVSTVSAPATAFSGQETLIEWTVTNAGTGATSAPVWYDAVWLSEDDEYDASDIYLGSVENSSYLNPGESYNNSLKVKLPEGIDANYRFIVKTDYGHYGYFRGQVYEYQNEDDNYKASDNSRVELTPPPDLQATVVTAPSIAFSGQRVTINWTVINNNAKTTQSAWYDEIYMSKNDILDDGDTYLGARYHYGQLDTNQTYQGSFDATLPVDASENYFFFVKVDAGKQVLELAYDANNIAHSQQPTNITLVTPDLEVESVDAPTSATASRAITISYRAVNYGITATPNYAWTDAFYLSTDTDFNPSTDTKIGEVTRYGFLDIGDGYNNTVTLTLPNGINGTFYAFVVTDNGNQVFEVNNNNNANFDATPITIASRPADLVVQAVDIANNIEAGKATLVRWTVKNQGAGDTAVRAWTDRIIASSDAELGNADDIVLDTFNHTGTLSLIDGSYTNGLLNPGESYSRSELVYIPFNLVGQHRLFVVTDADNQVYEASAETNNSKEAPQLVTILRETPDLQVTGVNAPTALVSGNKLTVDWTVKNFGSGRTNAYSWYDSLYLSTDTAISEQDIFLGQVFHSGWLDAQASYNASGTFNLPIDLQGNYHVIVRTDTSAADSRYNDRVLEGTLENNNDLSTTSKTEISQSAVPDLVVQSVDAPIVGVGGQLFSLNWTVKNNGADTGNRLWYDAVYLSRDQNFDRKEDIYLDYRFYTGGLAAGESYTQQNQLFKIPEGLSGPFYVFVATDAGNNIYERGGEGNNRGYDGYSMQVNLPTPIDLAVGAITIPANAVPGQDITISYTINTDATLPPSTLWYDSVYISADDQWDINDTFLGRVAPYAINGNYAASLTATLPGVVPGNYHVIVRSDIRNWIPESNENNNITASLDKVAIDVEALQLGGSDSGTLFLGQSVYYKVDVAAGETLQFNFDSASDDAFNELYIRYGQMPTMAKFDYAFENIAADQQVIVPFTESGTYYVLARAVKAPDWISNVVVDEDTTVSGLANNYTIEAKTIDFGITSIGQTVGDRGGKITLEIEGAKFNPFINAQLIDSAGRSIVADNIWVEDSTRVFATFDLTKATVGTYDIKVSQIDSYSTTNSPVIISNILEDKFSVVDARPDDVLITVTTPSDVWIGSTFDIIVSYANRGTHDVTAPVIVVSSNPDIRLENVQDGDGFAQYGSMTLLGTSNEGPAGILRPGETGIIRLRGTAPSETGAYSITARRMVDNGSPINYNEFIEYLGGNILTPEWAAAATALQEKFGNSWKSFEKGLAESATELANVGDYTHSATKLWSDVALDAWGSNIFNNYSAHTTAENTLVSALQASNQFINSQEVADSFSVIKNDANSSFNLANFISEIEDKADYSLPEKAFASFSLFHTYAENIVLEAASYIRYFGADIAAQALEYFVGEPYNDEPPGFNDSNQYQDNIYNKIGDNEIAKKIKNQNMGEVSGWKNASWLDGKYPYETPYEIQYLAPDTPISNAIKKSSEFQNKVTKNEALKAALNKEVSALVASRKIVPVASGMELGNDSIYLGKGLIGGFDYFNQKNLSNYPKYFESTESKELAFLIGRTGGDTQWVKVKSIRFDEAQLKSTCKPAKLDYTAEIEFYLWDGTTFNSDDWYKDEAASWTQFLIFALSGSTQPTIPGISNTITKIGEALGLGWSIQQAGYGRPRFNVVKVNHFLTGSIDNPFKDRPCPPNQPPTPPGDNPTGDNPTGDNPPNSPNSHDPGQSRYNARASHDPNDILGPNGFGTERWISATDPLNYTIRFENDPQLANAPAQVVRITQQLDSDLDFRTFRLGDFGFGDTFIDVPDNRAFYQTRLDLTETKGIYVDFAAGIDVTTGTAFWELKSIDPTTGIEPKNPLLGLLPPNITKPEGDGFVSYSVKAKSNVQNGAVIDAEARIIFDINEPIDTPPIFNTIDTGRPTSAVNVLPSSTNDTNFLVSWSGSDNTGGSALADFTIYVSENGGAFTPWLENTTLTEATFVGKAGKTYAFYSRARDNAGNVEAIPTSAQATITVGGSVDTGTLAFGAAEFSINEDGTPIAVVTITRTGGSQGSVSATITLSDDTAIASSDYNNTPIVVTFADGETSKTVNIPIIDDTLVESAEKIRLALSNPTGGATIGTRSIATLTIADNDVELAFSDTNFSINEDGTAIAAVTVTRTGRSAGAVGATITLGNGTASAPADYDNTDIEVSFEEGETIKTVLIPIVNDTLIESGETINLTLGNPTGGATIGSQNSATLTIVDDDVQLAFSDTNFSVNEDGTPVAAVTVTRIGRTTGAVGATITLSNGSASAPADYDNSTINVNFADGETSKTVLIPIVNDTLIESAETINLVLENSTNGATIGSQNSATLTIVDDDVQLGFSNTSFSVNENGTQLAAVTITRTGRSTGAVGVTVTPSNGTATSPADYDGTSVVVNFASGETTKTVVIPVVDDTMFESNETVTLTLSNPTGGATIGVQSTATLTIKDNDPLIGTANDDALIGGDGDDTIDGREGNDTLIGNAGNDNLIGGTGNDVLDGGTGVDRMEGNSGDDTYIVDNTSDTVIENSSSGTDTVKASVSFSIAALTNVENLTLTGNAFSGVGNALNNHMIGNASNNTLIAAAGNDTLDGGAGADRMEGGIGDDTYIVDNTGDTIIENFNEGTDTVEASVNFSIAAFANVENLILTGDAINGTGNALNNRIIGNTSNNTLNGGSGADQMSGGAGDDIYIVDSISDTVIENVDAGTDTIQAFIDYSIATLTNIENLTLTSGTSGTGNALNNRIIGNSLNNTLNGGAGNDQMEGGTGDDTYIVDSAADTIIEGLSSGTDTVQASVDYSIAGFANVENLTLTGSATSGTGNALSNRIIGNAQNNILNGGAGSDTMSGGAGDDTYIVDSAGDTVVENTSEGIDTVESTVTFSIAGFTNVENLTLTGTNSINGTGNALNNRIIGNSLNNTLNGGAGNDTMEGGAGDDTYIVDSGADTIIENLNSGTDTIQSSIDLSIAGFDNVENLTLTGGTSGTGNALNNRIIGNSLNNTLNGGAGNDTMEGGTGDDTYIVDSAADTIVEGLSSGTDTVQASVDYSIAGFANVENLTLTGSATSGTGNALSNRIIGNGLNNTLNGGTGADRMEGGAGDDTYIIDNASDTVIENASEGIDTIETSVSFSIASVTNVENLTLTGTNIINGTGNALSNRIIGNATNNTLDGGAGDDTLNGGAGNDTLNGGTENDTLNGEAGNDSLNGGAGNDVLAGGDGDDTYTVDSANDSIVEALNAGTDTVNSSITWILGDNLENLTLTGTSAINGTGNSLNNRIIGNSLNNTLDGGSGNDTMEGGFGDDIYIVDSTNDAIVENSSSGIDTIQTSIDFSIAALTNVENLTLKGNALNGTGNVSNNRIIGNALNNILNGGAGNDTMEGGTGDDTYIVDNASDTVIENASEGIDTIETSVTYSIALVNNVENLTLTGVSSISGTGNALNNRIVGNAYNNTLNGGAGNDTMEGGAGDDTYIVDSAGDTIVENSSSGTDIVTASVDYSIAAFNNVENLTLTGNAINGTGNALNNRIRGNSLNNTLDGGSGNDTMEGSVGNDIYIVDSATDTIVENTSSGTDTVQASVNFSIAAFGEVENLTLTGNAINGTGNSLSNRIIGNALNNILNGGVGSDTMEGGAGDDTYIVDNASDTVIENADSGADTIEASFNFSISGLTNIENLTLTGSAITGTGNSLSNRITGNTLDNTLNGDAGNDTLIGGAGNDNLNGGTGDDTLDGGAGNDTYTVDSISDSIVENANAGTDTVNASVSWTLGDNLENLTLTGTNAITGTGNALNNTVVSNSASNSLFGNDGNDNLTGNIGNDLLDGGTGSDILLGNSGNDMLVGGFGNDTLTGGIGVDTFVLNNPNQGIDSITDFSSADDTLQVSAAGFGGGLTAGAAIEASQILIGSGNVATNATQRFIYNTSTGALFFDADGNQTGFGAVQIATLSNRPMIGGNDISVIS